MKWSSKQLEETKMGILVYMIIIAKEKKLSIQMSNMQ